ncbi:hypothetical protein C8R45DRAFT_1037678 [Mycena sanguinolenta]|nr:hypothetical protein C8R45DRAFT_1037678 [Mycena sanguinolenta]
MELNAQDLTVESTRFALWTYREHGWLAKLEDEMEGAEEETVATKLTAVWWIMRIEMGSVPPDQIGKAAKLTVKTTDPNNYISSILLMLCTLGLARL